MTFVMNLSRFLNISLNPHIKVQKFLMHHPELGHLLPTMFNKRYPKNVPFIFAHQEVLAQVPIGVLMQQLLVFLLQRQLHQLDFHCNRLVTGTEELQPTLVNFDCRRSCPFPERLNIIMSAVGGNSKQPRELETLVDEESGTSLG